MTVQDKFFTSKSRNTLPQDRIQQECVEKSKECRKILQYLTIDGRHSILSNLEIIYQDVTTQNAFTYAESFNGLVSNIIYPIYSKRFSKRINFFKSDHDAFKISSINECLKYGQDCLVALTLFGSTLKTFYGTYHVLNKEFDGSMSSSLFNWETYYGTLVANTNFRFDITYEEMWNLMKISKFESVSMNTEVDVSSTRLQKDLVELLETILPSNNISLPDFLALIGYNDVFTLGNSNGQDERDFEKNCSAFKDRFHSSYKNFHILKELYPLLSIDPFHMQKAPCDLGIYFEKWIEYLSNLKQFSNIDSTNSAKGKISKFIAMFKIS